ncbi:beta-L-arabinofuranosidase domain-containing protein [Microbacterium sp. F51-2R]|uniref:beta-L-arabinofuranosidase domain-containing protein n=1 Tax=Microbacterium sp. F51-2R TaxID=3445777 RepID=UPI003FA0673C
MARRDRNRRRAPWGAGALALAVALGGMSAPAAAAEPLTVGAPVLDLKFEGGVTDSSSAANATELRGHQGGAPNVSYVPGVTSGSQAIKFGGNTYLSLGSSSSTQLLPSKLTLSFWIKPDAAMTGEEIITWNKAAYNSDGFYVSSVSNSNPLLLSVGTGSPQPLEIRATATDRNAFFAPGQWTHVAITYDSSTKSAVFYRNGVKVPTSAGNTSSPGIINSAANVTKSIGYNGPNYNGGYTKSSFDEYKLYSGIANATDVATLYEAGGGVIDKAALAQQDANGINLPTTASVALVLPTVGSNGSAITWASDKPSVIATDGTVTPPADGEDAVVKLTASVRYADGPAVTREFTVAVAAPKVPLQDSGLDVLLSDEYLQNAAAKEHEYLLSLSSDKFLFWFYKTANLTPPTTSGYGGWENGSVTWNFRGHAFGHYMSALAMSYASTKDPTVKAGLLAQIVDAVDGLETVQASYAGTARQGYIGPFRDTALDAVEGRGTSDDPVIVPYYNLHKVLAGLLDIDKYVPGGLGDRALTIAEGFGEYLYGRISTLPNKATLLGTEYGGMNDALYELFARSGGNAHFKVAAEGFDEVSLFQQLANGQDVLNGKHANTTIPKFIGALKRYTVFTQNPAFYDMLTAQEKQNLPMYRLAAENFFQIVVDHHSYATGANSQSEHFHGPDALFLDATQRGATTGNPQTAETCNEYNMLKLSRELFKISQDVKYANYYENTFINTIVSSQNPDTGMTTYFQAMAPGYFKVYGAPFTEFWCCIGTGMENFSKLSDSIYFSSGSAVWVNMFFSSQFDHAATGMRVKQTASIPNDDTVRFDISAIGGEPIDPAATLKLRVPDWIAGDPAVRVNGSAITPTIRGGYIVLTGLEEGDEISYTMPMTVRISATQDNKDFVAFKYGPVLLSTGLGTANLSKMGTVGVGVRIASFDADAQQRITVASATTGEWKQAVTQNVVRIADSAEGDVQFALKNTLNGKDLVYTPHYKRHDERYGLYMTLEVADSPAAQAEILQGKQQLRDQELIIDTLTTFDNNNSEASKNVKFSNSTVGAFSDRTYRHANAGGWFSYDLQVDPAVAQNFLKATYYSGDNGRSFDIYLNDVKFKTQTITNAAGSGVFYAVTDEIPRSYLEGAGVRYKVDANGAPVLDENGARIPVVTVRWQSTGGYAGGLFGVQTTRPAAFDSTSKLRGLTFSEGDLEPAFASDTTQYVLWVPEGTDAVSFDAGPWVPSGLVKTEGILIDDTQPRAVALTPGQDKTITIDAYAQDHTSTTQYSVVVREGSPAPALEATLTAATRCVAGKAVVTASLTNASGVPVAAVVASPYGSKSFTGVAPGKSVAQAFTTRMADVAATTVTAQVSGTIDGKSVTSELSAVAAAVSCGTAR